ncbi:hypothetical protein EYF80_061119 [Liparis tanakae]|uniref:Uncharacterized protein n=1 Tax=Liparis tanakae TaxID=230148 RepID=A0A4Z2EIS6_9TELE|nr:hypothetical protein EYF80_061119 [Liparis tanakae]
MKTITQRPPLQDQNLTEDQNWLKEQTRTQRQAQYPGCPPGSTSSGGLYMKVRRNSATSYEHQ